MIELSRDPGKVMTTSYPVGFLSDVVDGGRSSQRTNPMDLSTWKEGIGKSLQVELSTFGPYPSIGKFDLQSRSQLSEEK